MILASFISGFYIGHKSNSKGYLSGIKLSAIIVTSFLIINLATGGFKWYHLIYYLIIMLVTCLGSMIGINQKK